MASQYYLVCQEGDVGLDVGDAGVDTRSHAIDQRPDSLSSFFSVDREIGVRPVPHVLCQVHGQFVCLDGLIVEADVFQKPSSVRSCKNFKGVRTGNKKEQAYNRFQNCGMTDLDKT